MVTKSTTPQEATGVLAAELIVATLWKCDWIDVAQRYDGGIDGIVLLKNAKTHENTGRLAFVQVKCGAKYEKKVKSRPGFININLGRKHIDKHRDRWAKFEDPVILVWFEREYRVGDLTLPRGWWCDLKSADTYTKDNKGVILIPKEQHFSASTIRDVIRLAPWARVPVAPPVVDVGPKCFAGYKVTEPIKKAARRWYMGRAKAGPVSVSGLGDVLFTRVGWKHIVRHQRRRLHMLQSLQLLPAVPAVLQGGGKPRWLGRTKTIVDGDTTSLYGHLSVDAKVKFSHRQAAVVRVIIRQRTTLKSGCEVERHYWFLSAYEVSRGL